MAKRKGSANRRPGRSGYKLTRTKKTAGSGEYGSNMRRGTWLAESAHERIEDAQALREGRLDERREAQRIPWRAISEALDRRAGIIQPDHIQRFPEES